ncbi:MAG: glycosyltransferase [Oscillospiraceae bacterium]|nr:glycosyltransferase [Oscillospiraceae bacterium]
METRPLISVIVPVYRAEDRLDACVESIVAQDWTNLQIVLVNDGSPDNCGSICDKWEHKDARIEVIHKQNGGPSSARNAGLDIAKGDYVLFLDSDDLLDSTTCTHLYELMQEKNADVASCYQANVFSNAPAEFVRDGEVTVMDRESAILDMWYQRVFPSTCGKLFKRSIFDGLRFTEGLYFEDVDIIYQIYWKAERIAETTARLYGYVHHEGSITTREFSSADMDILTVVDKIEQFAHDKSQKLKAAATAYSVAAALRIVLNVPKKEEFNEGTSKAINILKANGKAVLKDKNIKSKLKIALILYFYFRPFIRVAYRFVNRWK